MPSKDSPSASGAKTKGALSKTEKTPAEVLAGLFQVRYPMAQDKEIPVQPKAKPRP